MRVYITLFGAIFFEVLGTLLLPVSKGFTKLVPSLFLLLSYGVSFYLLSIVSQKLSLAIIYATWAGMGIFLVTSLSYFIYKQALNWQVILGLCLIFTGVVFVNVYKS